MITTKEGDIKKKGDRVWEVGYCITNKAYRPTISKVHVGIGVANPDACWTKYENCLQECDSINRKESQKKIIEKRKKICQKLIQG
jgi:hypothetical protein